jgi:transposase
VTNILNLPFWNVTTVKEHPGQYEVEATYGVPPVACIHCGSVTGIGKHGTRPQEIVDVPSHGNRVRIQLVRTRHMCKDCGKTFLQPLPDVADSGSMTNRCVAYIERQSLKYTFAHVAGEVGVDEKTVRNIFNDYTEWLDKTVVFETPEILGIDELYLLGKPRCITTNIQKRTIIGLLEDRNKPTVHQYLFWLPDKPKIKVVTMDMWKPYRDAVGAILPDAAVVVDKFHIVRTATHALESVRRGLRDTMTATKRREVMRSRFLLLKRAHQLTDEQRQLVEEWTTTLPTIGMAYRLKEGFYSMFDMKERAAAMEAYKAWESSIPDEMRGAFKEVTTAMKNWEKEVFNYFDHGVANAPTEALNGLSKIINRTGRGYSFKAVRAKMLYGRDTHEYRPRKAPAGTSGQASASFYQPDEFRPFERTDADWLGDEPSFGVNIKTLSQVLEIEDRAAAKPPPPTPKVLGKKKRKR